MQKFEYRAPRFAVDLPARFIMQGSILIARCREISKDGMTLEVAEPLRPNSRGKVSVSCQNRAIELHARVTHAGEASAGLAFIYETDAERNEMARFVAALAVSQGRPGPVLLT